MRNKFAIILILIISKISFSHTVKPLNNFWFNKFTNNQSSIEVPGDDFFKLLNETFNGEKRLRGIHAFKFDFKIIRFGAKGCVLNLKNDNKGNYELEMVNMDDSVSRKSYSFKWASANLLNFERFRVRTGIDTYDNVYEIKTKKDLFGASSPSKLDNIFIYYNNDVRKVFGMAITTSANNQINCEIK